MSERASDRLQILKRRQFLQRRLLLSDRWADHIARLQLVGGDSRLFVDENRALFCSSTLIAKVRELCASTSNVQRRRLCVFERALQAEIAQIRAELEIEGLTPAAYEQLTSRKSGEARSKRNLRK